MSGSAAPSRTPARTRASAGSESATLSKGTARTSSGAPHQRTPNASAERARHHHANTPSRRHSITQSDGGSMPGHTRKMEGDENQRRKAAREARSEGKAPSEVGATLGASKQMKQAKND